MLKIDGFILAGETKETLLVKDRFQNHDPTRHIMPNCNVAFMLSSLKKDRHPRSSSFVPDPRETLDRWTDWAAGVNPVLNCGFLCQNLLLVSKPTILCPCLGTERHSHSFYRIQSYVLGWKTWMLYPFIQAIQSRSCSYHELEVIWAN